MQPAQNISAFQIEQSAQQLLKELRKSSQQKRYPEDLHTDVNKIIKYSQILSTAEENGVSAKELYKIAKTIASPLKRIDRYFSFSKGENRVGTANRDMINMLIAYAKQIRKPTRNRPKKAPRRSFPRNVAPVPNPRDDFLTIPGNNRDKNVLTIPDNTGVEEEDGLSLLPKEDRFAAIEQKVCPVTEEPLGSMGKPIKVNISGRSIFVCCQGCVKSVKKNPEKYLAFLDS